MGRVHITRADQQRIVREIDDETKKLYQDRYGKRNPDTISTWDLNQIRTEAGRRVQDRRKGRLVP